MDAVGVECLPGRHSTKEADAVGELPGGTASALVGELATGVSGLLDVMDESFGNECRAREFWRICAAVCFIILRYSP